MIMRIVIYDFYWLYEVLLLYEVLYVHYLFKFLEHYALCMIFSYS